MNNSVLRHGKLFFDAYFPGLFSNQPAPDPAHPLPAALVIVDVSSKNVNGLLQQFAPTDSQYLCFDFAAGAAADAILTDPHVLPFETASVDVVVCNSVYEHRDFFLLLLLESLRILKPNGLLYLNSPSEGEPHRHPIEARLFYPAAGKSLTNWVRRNGMRVVLVESFIGIKTGDVTGDRIWNDFVAVIARDENHIRLSSERIVNSEPAAECVYVWDRQLPLVDHECKPDLHLTATGRNPIDQAQAEVSRLSRQTAEYAVMIAAYEKKTKALVADVYAKEKELRVFLSNMTALDDSNREKLRQADQIAIAENESLRQVIAAHEKRTEALVAQMHAREGELNVILAEMTAMRDSSQEKFHQVDQAASVENESLRQVITALRASTSWRITSPLRLLGGALVRLRAYRELRSTMASTSSTSSTSSTISTAQLLPSQAASDGQTDAERACESAAFEVLSGLQPQAAPATAIQDSATLIAFYLPQYHQVAENSEWWGPGFTEWTNVVKGRPNFDGHYQPHLPREIGFYDLSDVKIMKRQADMAKLYGVGAFCFYYYWFSGRRILDKPIDNFLSSDIDMPYCLCWANENWTRTWDGDTRSVLLEQQYQPSDPLAFIESVLPHFNDKRYLKVDGKPMLVVYRAKDIPSVAHVFSVWRSAVKAAGFPDLHIVVVDFYDISRPDEVAADAMVEFPPHKFNGPQTVPQKMPTVTNSQFRGGIVDYTKVMAQSANRSKPDFTLYRGVLPSWDNTARRQNTPTILYGSSAELFAHWLRYIRAYTRENFSGRADNFIFVNAWNEWGEGCHLEPDQEHGLGYLEAVQSSSWHDASCADTDFARHALFAAAAGSIEQRHRLNDEPPPCKVEIEQTLQSVSHTDSKAHKIGLALRGHPRVHSVAKRIYKAFQSAGKQ